jgi:hypothetical protein
MFQLQHGYFSRDLYDEFLKERKTYYFWLISLNMLGYTCFFTYLILLFLLHKTNPKYLFLDFYSLYTRLSVLVLYKYFEIPNIVLDLFSKPRISANSMYTIENHREEILGTLFKNLYGYAYDRNLLYSSKEEIMYYVQIRQRLNWKLLGKFYLGVHLFISLYFFYFILNIE